MATGKLKYLLTSFLTGVVFLFSGCSVGEESNIEEQEKKTEEPSLEADLMVMTYNIHLGNPPSAGERRDLVAIAGVINEAAPDLVALQEVDVNTERSGIDVNQAETLAEMTGMYWYFVKAMDVFGGGEYGEAVLSKFPIIDSKGYELPAYPGTGGETRSVAIINVELPNGRKVNFAGTHLDHRSEQNRIHQGEKLNGILQGLVDPVILAGDFNDVPQSATVDFFDTNYNRTCRHNCSPTFPASNPRSAIDFIMFRKKDNIKVVSHKIITETYASDHLPVLAGLKII